MKNPLLTGQNKAFYATLPNLSRFLNFRPGCANGGLCVDPDVCSCPDGYTGARCQTGNDSMCYISQGNRVVSDPENFIWEPAERPLTMPGHFTAFYCKYLIKSYNS